MTLRPIKMSDAPRFARWFSDPEVHQFLALRKKNITLKEEQKFLRKKLKDKGQCNFAIDTIDGVHIGSVGFKLAPLDKRATLGIAIGDKQYWGKGCGTDAMIVILRYGFQKLRLHKIELEVHNYNPRAIAVYEKLGFRQEGVRRDYTLWKNKFYDCFSMGILNEEWKKTDYVQSKHRAKN